MTTLTLLTRINNDKQLKQVDATLKRAFEGLKVEAKILGTVAGRWVKLALAGEDESIATSYILKEMGVCPASVENVKKLSTLKGFITNLARSKEALSVDVGVFQPEVVQATVPLRSLQDCLVDGRKLAMKKIAELFGFCEGLPIDVKVVRLDGEEFKIEAELSRKQKGVYEDWRESLLDRLIVLGPALHEIERTLDHARLERDVIGVEPLGMFEHALMCKLGTDAAGLIPTIGRSLKDARFAVFNPKRLWQFLKA